MDDIAASGGLGGRLLLPLNTKILQNLDQTMRVSAVARTLPNIGWVLALCCPRLGCLARKRQHVVSSFHRQHLGGLLSPGASHKIAFCNGPAMRDGHTFLVRPLQWWDAGHMRGTPTNPQSVSDPNSLTENMDPTNLMITSDPSSG